MLTTILLPCLIILIACGIGKKALSILKLYPDDFWEDLAFSAGLGLGITSLSVLALGSLKLLYPAMLLVLLMLGAIISFKPIKELCLKAIKFNHYDLGFTALLAAVVTASVRIAWAFPLVFDELTYHLALPARYLSLHAVSSIPYNLYSNFPLNLEMLYVFGLAFGSASSCRLIYISILAFCGIAIFALGKKHFSSQAGLFAAMLFFSIPNVLFHSINAYNDFGLVLFVVLSIYGLLNWEKENKGSWLILSGIFCGLALGVKYTGMINFMLLGSYVFFRKRSLRETAIFSFSALAFFSPWLIKNLLFTGNPVYPFLYNIFGGKYWNAFNDQRYFYVLGSYGPKSLTDLPWNLIAGLTLDRPLGPLIFLVLAFIIFIKPVDRKIKYFLLYSGLYLIVWALSSRVIRFYLSPAALLCISCGYIIERYKIINKSFYLLLLSFSILFCGISLWFFCTTAPQGIPYVEKELSGYFESAAYVKENLPPGARVLFIGEIRTFGFGPGAFAGTMFDKNIITEIVKASKDPEEIKRRLKQEGYTHLLINNDMLPWLNNKFDYFQWENDFQQELYDRFIKSSYLKAMKRFNGIIIYAIV